MTIKRGFKELNEALVVSRLARDIAYCEVQTKRGRYQIVVLDGVPYELRLFNSIMISRMGGDIPMNLRKQINTHTTMFWEDIGFKSGSELESYSCLGSWKLLMEFTESIKVVNGATSDEFESTDYLEMMKTISRFIHEEKQLRLGNVNDNSLVA
jgi:hypothetical protein